MASVKCTFFVLGRTAERYPSLVQELKCKGHEIASHGYAHTPVGELTIREFAEDIDRSVRVIRELTGANPIGYRAPYFSVSRATPWVYDILREREFKYSSS